MKKRVSARETVLLALMPVIALVVSLLLAQTALYSKVNAWVSDTQQYLFAKEMYFDDVVFIDIDDASLFELEKDLGVWPYNRDVYAEVLDYLTDKGVNRVIFDLLLTETREGDQVLAESVREHDNAVFIASSPVHASSRQYQGEQHERLLQQLSWQVASDVPMTPLEKLVLPTKGFIQSTEAGKNVGVVDVFVDEDGTFRRLPAIYQVGNAFLPSIPVLLQQTGSTTSVNKDDKDRLLFDAKQQAIIYNDDQWPVDDKGMFNIYFPKNANSILSMSFYPVVQAAKGLLTPDNADTFFQGKTVFISSTAFKSDLVNTPRGMMSGSYFLAIVYQNLKHDLLLKAPKKLFDGILLLLALAPLFLFPIFCHYAPWKHAFALILTAVEIWCVNSLFLLMSSQQSVLFLPLFILFLGYFLQSVVLAKFSTKRNESLARKAQVLAENNQELAMEANTDSLTNLFNRRALLSHFEREITRTIQMEIPLSVAILDLDHFKDVNDNYGHEVGDQVLRMFANIMSSNKRDKDIVARWGGEEFVMLLPGLQDKDAVAVLDRLRQKAGELIVNTEKGPLTLTVSIGVTQYDSNSMNGPEVCISVADKALYQAKESGRNRVCLAVQDSIV